MGGATAAAAASPIGQQPACALEVPAERPWEGLPQDVLGCVLAHLHGKQHLAAMRAACRAWKACVDGHVSSLHLG